MDAPLALYRRYRPDRFADMIGQEHVTGPLSAALANNRVHHAYLFSGPRGCGKTTSARIMARALNCEKGPTPEPCGECDSCRDLATGGPGSIDVIEIDAASHGGVNDARDLRERAFFTPVRSRYKVYIIDEAHMVSKEGFNALLKLVEEPPSHLRFIFATTEPDKVIGTIRSRTHHYPFRLVAPKVLGDYLVLLCAREGIAIEPTVVPLVVRAGGGSVRDSLSVLDQLIGGSGDEGITYALATALLGYTPDSLLDETMDALAAGDGATVFGVVEKVIETGQDPRRFTEDLLHRLRDLVVLSAVPDAADRGIIDVPDDQAERLVGQSTRFGRAELTRAADIVSTGLAEMRGATAPRLLLEIMCARILLPGLDQTAEGIGARVDRLERRLSVGGDAPVSHQAPPSAEPAEAKPPAPARAEPTAKSDSSSQRKPASGAPRQQPEQTAAPPTTPSAAPGPGGGTLTLVDVRRLWPGVLERVKNTRRFAWMQLSQYAQVKDVRDGVLTIAFAGPGPAKNFTSSGNDEILRQALIDELGVDWRVESIIDGPGAAPTPSETTLSETTPPGAVPRATAADPSAAEVRRLASEAQPVDDGSADVDGGRSSAVQAVKSAIRPTRTGPRTEEPVTAESAGVSPDDEVVDDAALTSQELLARELGAEVISEQSGEIP